jgi:hypothetical protein
MKPYFRCPIILVILVLFVPAKSQIPAFNNSFAEGKVIDDSTGQNVAFVHIFNESSRLGFIGNEKVNFGFRPKQEIPLFIALWDILLKFSSSPRRILSQVISLNSLPEFMKLRRFE